MTFRNMTKQRELHARLMSRMMDRSGLDMVECCRTSTEVTIYRAARTCLACGSTDECRRWLADPVNVEGPAEFCPNGRLFRELRGTRVRATTY